jgi:hypothetical protein
VKAIWTLDGISTVMTCEKKKIKKKPIFRFIKCGFMELFWLDEK